MVYRPANYVAQCRAILNIIRKEIFPNRTRCNMMFNYDVKYQFVCNMS